MIKRADTAGYVSISGRKIAAILLVLFCSFALAWAGRGGKGNVSVKRAQPLMAHTNQAPMSRGHVSPATHNHNTATGQAHTHHMQGALSNFKPHIVQASRAAHSKGAGQGANQGASGGGGASSGSDATPSPTPEESQSLTESDYVDILPADLSLLLQRAQTSDTTLDLSATATTPAPLP